MYYTCEEIAERFKVKKATVWGWIRSGRLSAVRAGKFYRVSGEDIRAFLEKESKPFKPGAADKQ